MLYTETLLELSNLLDTVRSCTSEVDFKLVFNALNDEIDQMVLSGSTMENRLFLYDLIYISTQCRSYIKSGRTALYEKIIFDLELAIIREQVRIRKIIESDTY